MLVLSSFLGFAGWLILVYLGLEGLGVFVFIVFVFLLLRLCFLFFCFFVLLLAYFGCRSCFVFVLVFLFFLFSLVFFGLCFFLGGAKEVFGGVFFFAFLSLILIENCFPPQKKEKGHFCLFVVSPFVSL